MVFPASPSLSHDRSDDHKQVACHSWSPNPIVINSPAASIHAAIQDVAQHPQNPPDSAAQLSHASIPVSHLQPYEHGISHHTSWDLQSSVHNASHHTSWDLQLSATSHSHSALTNDLSSADALPCKPKANNHFVAINCHFDWIEQINAQWVHTKPDHWHMSASCAHAIFKLLYLNIFEFSQTQLISRGFSMQ